MLAWKVSACEDPQSPGTGLGSHLPVLYQVAPIPGPGPFLALRELMVWEGNSSQRAVRPSVGGGALCQSVGL